MFIGRSDELSYLESQYAARGGRFVVLYGRRRVGKTELLRTFCRGKAHVFYTCIETTDSAQLAALSARILAKGGEAARYLDAFRDWRQAFEAVADMPGEGKRILVLDEFPYAARRNGSLPSVLQAAWDEGLKDREVMIVLCGSAMSWMEKEVLSAKNPLYGRATGVLKLLPLGYRDAARFLPRFSPADRIASYAILGGIPHYLKQFDDRRPLGENVRDAILSRGGVLYSEPEFLLRQELRDPAVYNAAIRVVASGATRLNEIEGKTLVDRTSISTYLKNLVSLGIVRREFPVDAGEKEAANEHRGLYRIADNFFRFWYSFVFPNLPELESGDAAGVWRHIVEPTLGEFVSIPFEEVCRQWLRERNRTDALPFHFTKLGRWWHDGDEIDIAAFGRKTVLLGECKYRRRPFRLSDLREFEDKTIPGTEGWETHRYVFSRSGFSADARAAAANGRFVAVGTEDLFL